MKRQLNSKYEDLVDYVNERKHCKGLGDILSEAIKEGKRNNDKDSKLRNILESLYITALDDTDFIDLTKTIVDIFEDNYDLEESENYWKFKELRGFGRCDLYFGITFDDEPLLVDISDCGTAEKCTKTELNSYLLDTNLTVDNFANVEDIEND